VPEADEDEDLPSLVGMASTAKKAKIWDNINQIEEDANESEGNLSDDRRGDVTKLNNQDKSVSGSGQNKDSSSHDATEKNSQLQISEEDYDPEVASESR